MKNNVNAISDFPLKAYEKFIGFLVDEISSVVTVPTVLSNTFNRIVCLKI